MSIQETVQTTGDRRLQPLEMVLWIVLVIYLALVICFAWNPTPLGQGLAAVGILAACAHAVVFYGWKDALALFTICVTITFAVENIGVATGWPFGHYHFEIGSNLPHVGAIPIIVGPLWFGMGYFSWIVAGTLLGGAQGPLNRKIELMVLPIVAAFVITQWDAVIDPPESTISKGLDMARWRRAFWRSAFELSRLVTDHVAVLSGVHALSDPPAPWVCAIRRT